MYGPDLRYATIDGYWNRTCNQFLHTKGVSSMATPLEKWVDEQAKLTKPSKIHWCDGTEAEAKKLIEIDKAHFIIGAYGSAETLSVAPVAEKAKVILITPGSQAAEISDPLLVRIKTEKCLSSRIF